MVFLDSLVSDAGPADLQDFTAKMYQWTDQAFYHLGLMPAYVPGKGKLDLSSQGFGTFVPPNSLPTPPQTTGGPGSLLFTAKAASDRPSVNPNLIRDLEKVASSTGLRIQVTTAITGHRYLTSSGHISRHNAGNAVDISIIDDVPVNVANVKGAQYGDALVAALVQLGYVNTGSEAGFDRAILWRVAEHYNHVHVSNRIR